MALGGLIPGLALAVGPWQVPPLLALAAFGLAVWCAATMLGWAVEVAELDIAGALALALVAIVALLPEYVVDVLLAYKAGADPSRIPEASANMNGATRLVIGLGLPLVVLLGLRRQRRRAQSPQASGLSPLQAKPPRFASLEIPAEQRSIQAFAVLASLVAMLGVATGRIHIILGLVLILVFAFFLWHASQGEVEEPELVGVAEVIGALAKRRRWTVITAMFVLAAVTILLVADPFVESLRSVGEQFGLPNYLLIQWLAPLASEAPEFIIALTLAAHGRTAAAVAMLTTAVVNQWSALVGSLPIAFKLGGGGWALPLTMESGRQMQEFALTASLTLLVIAFLVSLRIPSWACWYILASFVAEFALPDRHARLTVAAVNGAVALVMLVIHARHLPQLVTEPLRVFRSRRKAVSAS